MRKALLAIALAAIVSGCTSVKQVFPFLQGDPIDAAATAVNTANDIARLEWIDPKCEAKPDADICIIWTTRVEPSLSAAIDTARKAYDLAQSGGDPGALATGAIDIAWSAVDQAVNIEGSQKAQDIGRHIKSALVILRNLTKPA